MGRLFFILILVLTIPVLSCARPPLEGCIITGDWFEPLPPRLLDLVDYDYPPHLRFKVWVVENNPFDPLDRTHWGVWYSNEHETLRCWGGSHQPYKTYDGLLEPDLKDEFVALIHFFRSEEEFFTYEEFDDADPGRFNEPHYYDIAIGVAVEGYYYDLDLRANTYGIQKYVTGGPSEAEQHVIDVMRDVFLPVVLENERSKNS